MHVCKICDKHILHTRICWFYQLIWSLLILRIMRNAGNAVVRMQSSHRRCRWFVVEGVPCVEGWNELRRRRIIMKKKKNHGNFTSRISGIPLFRKSYQPFFVFTRWLSFVATAGYHDPEGIHKTHCRNRNPSGAFCLLSQSTRVTMEVYFVVVGWTRTCSIQVFWHRPCFTWVYRIRRFGPHNLFFFTLQSGHGRYKTTA